MTDADFVRLSDALRRWADGDTINTAAVELLIWHEYWLRRPGFKKASISHYPRDRIASIRWDQAREFHDSGPTASTSQMAVLDLAVAIGENRYRLSSFGHAHRRAVAQAFAAAVGLRLESAVPEAGHNHPGFIPGDPATCKACALPAADERRAMSGAKTAGEEQNQ